MAVPGTPLSSADAQKGKAASASGTMLKPVPIASDAHTMVALRASGLLSRITFMPETERLPKAVSSTLPGVALCGQGRQKTKKPYTPARVYGEKTRLKNPHEFYEHNIPQPQNPVKRNFEISQIIFGAPRPS